MSLQLWQRLQPREQRAVLWGGAVITLALLATRAVPAAVRAERALSRRIELERAQVVRMRREVQAMPALEDSARRLAAALPALAPRLLTGSTVAEAAADLGARLRLVADAHHVRLDAVTPTADSARAGDLVRVRVRVVAEGDTRGLLEWLAAIERSRVVLGADEMRLAAARPDAPRSAPEVIRAEGTVWGWYFAHDAEQAGAAR